MSLRDFFHFSIERFLLFGSFIFLLFSCSEISDSIVSDSDSNKNNNDVLTAAYAQQWFEENYKPVISTRSSYESTQKCLMKPKWENAKESKRQRYEVVETPVMVNHHRLMMDKNTGKQWKPDANYSFVRNTAKTVVIHDKKTDKIRSFVMVFVGSYDYLKRTRSMGKNTYLYRQPDFDGMVLFYEINGTFINGWKYSEGKITGSISPNTDEKGKTSDLTSKTRAWYQDCYTDYILETYETCEDDISIEYDDEYGESWIITNTCWDETEWIPIEVCEDYWENDDDDENWNQDDPIGGSYTPGNRDYDEEYNELINEYNKKMSEAKKILAELGIDISKYKIRLGSGFCETNARVLIDKTIEICARTIAYYTSQDLASILWHEIYHIEHGHYEEAKVVTACDPFYLVLDNSIIPYIDAYLDVKYDGYGTKEEYLNEFLLKITALSPIEWYEHEIETYNAEFKKNIEHSTKYEADMHFSLWQYEQIYNYLKNK